MINFRLKFLQSFTLLVFLYDRKKYLIFSIFLFKLFKLFVIGNAG